MFNRIRNCFRFICPRDCDGLQLTGDKMYASEAAVLEFISPVCDYRGPEIAMASFSICSSAL